MRIKSKDFIVKGGKKVYLDRHPTCISPVYKSDKNYKEVLSEHVAWHRL